MSSHMLFAAIVAVILVYFIYRFQNRNKYAGTSGSPTAFGKLADADGKIVALKVATEAKKAEVEAAHAALDEVHALLG